MNCEPGMNWFKIVTKGCEGPKLHTTDFSIRYDQLWQLGGGEYWGRGEGWGEGELSLGVLP